MTDGTHYIKIIRDGNNVKIMKKVTPCKGEGQGSCKRCDDKGIWNRHWMWDLYKIEGYEGCYCEECMKEIIKEEEP